MFSFWSDCQHYNVEEWIFFLMPYIVDLDRDTPSIIPDANLVLLSIHRDSNSVHVFVSLLVVRSID